MLKKTITYKDLDGNPVIEDFYFNLSKSELAEIDVSSPTSFTKKLENLIASENGGEILSIFKDIIGRSIGRRSENNKRFEKSEEIRQDFFQSDAWDVLFMELIESEDGGAAFITAVLPADVAEAAEKAEKTKDVELPDFVPSYIRENRDPTKDELQLMTPNQLREAFQRKASPVANVQLPASLTEG